MDSDNLDVVVRIEDDEHSRPGVEQVIVDIVEVRKAIADQLDAVLSRLEILDDVVPVGEENTKMSAPVSALGPTTSASPHI